MLKLIRKVLCFLLCFLFLYLGAANIIPNTPAILCAVGMFVVGAFSSSKDFV